MQPRVFVISDTHFHHKNIVAHGWRDEGFEDRILKNLEILKAEDILIHLGDVCLGEDAAAHEKFIAPLPCKKGLLRGNHDHRTTTWYLRYGNFESRRYFDP